MTVVIDLHTHSTCSDGTSSPADLVREAARLGVDVLAITDHDTADGWADASDAAREVGIGLVPGMEISTKHEQRGVHLLAYLPDPTEPALAGELARILDGREGRLAAMLELLEGAGVVVTESEVRAQSAGGVIGRPHVADALVAAGASANRTAAFDEWLSPGRIGFVVRYAPSTPEMIEIVNRAGGVAVLAHPWGRGSHRVLDRETIAMLRDHGLAGLEVDHHDHTRSDSERLRAIADDLGLVTTGSSDHHGTGKIDHELGSRSTSVESLRRLLDLAERHAIASGRPVPAVVGDLSRIGAA